MTNETQRQDVKRETQIRDRIDKRYKSFNTNKSAILYLEKTLSHEKLLSPETARTIREYYTEKCSKMARDALEYLKNDRLKYADKVGSQELYLELLEGYGSRMGRNDEEMAERIPDSETKKEVYSRIIKNYLAGNPSLGDEFHLSGLLDLASKSKNPDEAYASVLDNMETICVDEREYRPVAKSQNPRLDIAKKLASRGYMRALEKLLDENDLDINSAFDIAENAKKHGNYNLATRLFERCNLTPQVKSCCLSMAGKGDFRRAYELALRLEDGNLWADLLHAVENPLWAAIFAARGGFNYAIETNAKKSLEKNPELGSRKDRFAVEDLDTLLELVPKDFIEKNRELIATRYEGFGKLQKAIRTRKAF